MGVTCDTGTHVWQVLSKAEIKDTTIYSLSDVETDTVTTYDYMWRFLNKSVSSRVVPFTVVETATDIFVGSPAGLSFQIPRWVSEGSDTLTIGSSDWYEPNYFVCVRGVGIVSSTNVHVGNLNWRTELTLVSLSKP